MKRKRNYHSERGEESLEYFSGKTGMKPTRFAPLKMTMPSWRFNAVTIQRFTTSSVDLDHEVSIRIDIAPVHAVCIKRQSDVSVSVDRDQTACAAELFNSVQSCLRRFLQCHT